MNEINPQPPEAALALIEKHTMDQLMERLDDKEKTTPQQAQRIVADLIMTIANSKDPKNRTEGFYNLSRAMHFEAKVGAEQPFLDEPTTKRIIDGVVQISASVEDNEFKKHGIEVLLDALRLNDDPSNVSRQRVNDGIRSIIDTASLANGAIDAKFYTDVSTSIDQEITWENQLAMKTHNQKNIDNKASLQRLTPYIPLSAGTGRFSELNKVANFPDSKAAQQPER